MGTIACLLALINIGSTVAFNIVTSVTVNGMFSAYFIGNALFLWRRITGKIKTENEADDGLRNVDDINLVWGPFRIPEPLGTIVNAFGCSFILIVLFFGFWPAVIDPTPVSMNYASLMVGATLIFSMIYYLIWAKRTYTGPVIQISE
jgi:hypothetical protein